MITLIIVDCQNDFITGTLAVKGSKTALEEIKGIYPTADGKLISEIVKEHIV